MPDGNMWDVKTEGLTEPETICYTKAEAIGFGIEQARIGHVSLVIHGRDGVIENVWSYDHSTLT